METKPVRQAQVAGEIPLRQRAILSYRQMQFLALWAEGKTWDEIAAECFVAPKTVQNTIWSARERLGAKSSAHALVIAISLELLSLDSEGHVSVPEEYNPLFDPGGHRFARRSEKPDAIAA